MKKVFWRHQAKAKKDQVGHKNFKNFSNIHHIPPFNEMMLKADSLDL